MFCPECGTKNKEDALFCENCGSRLRPEETLMPKAKKRFAIKQKLIFLEVVILAGVMALFYFAGKKLTAPERIASLYFEKVMAADWDGVYQSLELGETEFINLEKFKELHTKAKAAEITNYKITAGNEKDGKRELTKNIEIQYQVKGETEDSCYKVSLIRQKNKGFLFFDQWKVVPKDMVVNQVKFFVPHGAKAALDGVSLSGAWKEEESRKGSRDVYQVDALFSGNHSIALSQKDREDYEENLLILPEGEKEFEIEELKVKREIKEKVIQESGQVLLAIYEAILNQRDFKEVSPLFSADPEVQYEIGRNYHNVQMSSVYGEGIGLKKIDFKETIGSVEQITEEDQVVLKVQLDCTFDYTIQSKNWWSGKLAAKKERGFSKPEFYYRLENGKWVLYNTNFQII